MAPVKLNNVKKCLINTGNILSLNDITRKTGLNPIEELTEAINITIKEFQNGPLDPSAGKAVIYRPSDDLLIKIAEEPLSNLKVGLKIFLNSDSKTSVKEAIEEAFKTLKVTCVHSVVFAYKKSISESVDDITSLKNIYTVLEEYVKQEKINQIGLADVEEQTFRNIYEWATIKPTIIQINLATCCVVPPTLQAFCKDNELQLLTHSDPVDILPKNVIEESLNVSLPLQWITRFLVHIKCRGVLITKGYLVCLGED